MKFKQYIRESKQSQIWLWLRPSEHWHAHLNVLTLDSNSDSLKWQLVVEYYEMVYYYFCNPVTDEQTLRLHVQMTCWKWNSFKSALSQT